MKLPDGITMTPEKSDDPGFARFKMTVSQRAQIRIAVERWIDSRNATLIARHDVQDPVSRERAIELFTDMYLSIGTSASAVARDRALKDPEFVARINDRIAKAGCPELRQVGWHGPYGIIPGGMDVDAREDWVPAYIKVDKQEEAQ